MAEKLDTPESARNLRLRWGVNLVGHGLVVAVVALVFVRLGSSHSPTLPASNVSIALVLGALLIGLSIRLQSSAVDRARGVASHVALIVGVIGLLAATRTDGNLRLILGGLALLITLGSLTTLCLVRPNRRNTKPANPERTGSL